MSDFELMLESVPNEKFIDDSVLAELESLPGAAESGLVARVIALYLETSYPVGAVIRGAVDAGDAAGIASAAHRLKSSSHEVGAIRLAELCKELEALGRAEDLDQVDALAGRVETELERVYESLSARTGPDD